MTDEIFERLVSEGIETVPERFLHKLDNVAIVIAESPTQEQLSSNHVGRGEGLLGLYEGIPLTHRGDFYGMGIVLPDRITIFKKSILNIAGDDEERVKNIVRDTVWHEIAHFFGYNDEVIKSREERGTNYSS